MKRLKKMKNTRTISKTKAKSLSMSAIMHSIRIETTSIRHNAVFLENILIRKNENLDKIDNAAKNIEVLIQELLMKSIDE